MGLFGQRTARIQARAVARCYKPGYGDPAVLALSNAPDAIDFNGGGGSGGVSIIGDIVSHGGINPSGHPSHFAITGAAYALSQPAATNVTATNGSYGTNSGVGLFDVPDPIAQGMNAQPSPTIVWPYNNFHPSEPNGLAAMPTGEAKICDDPWGPWPGESGDCPDADPPDTDTNNITVGSSEYARFKPGKYGDVRIQGDAQFAPGVYSFESIDVGGGAVLTDNTSKGRGVLFQVRGPTGIQFDAAGHADFDFRAIQPNTWLNVVLYLPSGSVDMTGTGTRSITGSIYAPNGAVAIKGDGTDAVVNGQIIASTVEFSGNGPTVNYSGAGARASFGPILVNTPD
jgi:hypothetical protein